MALIALSDVRANSNYSGTFLINSSLNLLPSKQLNWKNKNRYSKLVHNLPFAQIRKERPGDLMPRQ